MAYQSKLANFAPAGVSQVLVNKAIEVAANSGRVPAHAVEITNAIGFELPAKPLALILALNAAQNAKPFNTKKGHALLLELFAMAQAIVDSGRVKNLPALVLPEWATKEARENEEAKKAAKKGEKKEKGEAPAPSVTIVTLDILRQQIGLLSDGEKESLLQFIAESLGYEMAIS